MHTFLIIASPNSHKDLINSTKPIKSRLIPFTTQKIDQARDLSTFLSTQPPNTCILIEDINLASPETQVALLKTLEEPPPGITIILTAPSTQSVLPTLVSRCQIVRSSKTTSPIDQSPELIRLSTSDLLKNISTIKSRQDALNFCKSMLLQSHNSLLKNPNKKIYNQIIELSLNTISSLHKNANTSLQLTSFVAKIDSARQQNTN